MKKIANAGLYALVWLSILAGCFFFLAALGLFSTLWRFFKWLARI